MMNQEAKQAMNYSEPLPLQRQVQVYSGKSYEGLLAALRRELGYLNCSLQMRRLNQNMPFDFANLMIIILSPDDFIPGITQGFAVYNNNEKLHAYEAMKSELSRMLNNISSVFCPVLLFNLEYLPYDDRSSGYSYNEWICDCNAYLQEEAKRLHHVRCIDSNEMVFRLGYRQLHSRNDQDKLSAAGQKFFLEMLLQEIKAIEFYK